MSTGRRLRLTPPAPPAAAAPEVPRPPCEFDLKVYWRAETVRTQPIWNFAAWGPWREQVFPVVGDTLWIADGAFIVPDLVVTSRALRGAAAIHITCDLGRAEFGTAVELHEQLKRLGFSVSSDVARGAVQTDATWQLYQRGIATARRQMSLTAPYDVWGVMFGPGGLYPHVLDGAREAGTLRGVSVSVWGEFRGDTTREAEAIAEEAIAAEDAATEPASDVEEAD